MAVWPLLCRLANLYRRTILRSTRVVAVVGSFGKTTTARAVLSALGEAPNPGVILHVRVWLCATIFRPRPRQRHSVVEVPITGPGQMARYAHAVRPDIAVVTAVGSDHNRSLGSLEVTRNEKAEMVRILPVSGLAVLNGDDSNVLWMAGQTRARVVTFGFGEANDIRATAMKLEWPRGTRFRLLTPMGFHDICVRLIGRPGVYATLAAVAVALNEGFPLDAVIAALEAMEPTQGRLQPVHLTNGAILLRDDYKSPEEAIHAALDVLNQIPARRRIVVMGDISEPVGRQHVIYRRLGERIGQVASRAIFLTSGKNLRVARAGARTAGLSLASVISAGKNFRKAVEAVQSDLGPGDVVLIKGRNTQRLERVALALMGRTVRCELVYCCARYNLCDRCPMIEKNWQGLWKLVQESSLTTPTTPLLG
ncbi:MAG: hypothetical protein HY695_15480 [Deltaproteobacteria bacterium]|nr:hypothetical protein [Deltaproteobacteria bacterium]